MRKKQWFWGAAGAAAVVTLGLLAYQGLAARRQALQQEQAQQRAQARAAKWKRTRLADEAPASPRQRAEELPGIPIQDGFSIGEPAVFENLAVFAVYGRRATAPGSFVALSSLVRGGDGEVREMGRPRPEDTHTSEVHALLAEHRGVVPALALGGTVLEGGLQDRVIAHDILFAPGKTSRFAVFCAERSRWDEDRNGVETNGIFSLMPALSGPYIRATAELASFEEGKTWDKQKRIWKSVDRVNEAHCQHPTTGTLTASLNNETISAKRDALAAHVSDYLAARAVHDHVVGMALAVGGAVKSVRIFADETLFEQLRDTLAKTAAFEGLAASSRRGDVRVPAASETLPQDQVVQFVRAIAEHPDSVEERRPQADTSTRLLLAERGYGTQVHWHPHDSDARPVMVTASYVARPADEDIRAGQCSAR